MNPLIFILTSEADKAKGYHDAIYDTWLTEWGALIDYKFLFSREHTAAADDELVVDAPLGYMEAVYVVQEAVRWALHNKYENVCIATSDTYFAIPRMLASDFKEHDFVGLRCNPPYFHVTGGPGYWLSRHACRVLIQARTYLEYQDLWASRELQKAGIELWSDTRYWDSHDVTRPFLYNDPQAWDTGIFAVHLGFQKGRVYDPECMRECHHAYLARTLP